MTDNNLTQDNFKVIAYIDKTMVKIVGFNMNGLKPYQIEDKLQEILSRQVRVVGVSGNSLEIDVYNIAPEDIWRNEEGIIKAITTCEGLSGEEIAKIATAEKAPEISLEKLKKESKGAICPRERRLRCDEKPY